VGRPVMLTYLGKGNVAFQTDVADPTMQLFSKDYGRTWTERQPLQPSANKGAHVDGKSQLGFWGAEGNNLVDRDAQGVATRIAQIGWNYDPGKSHPAAAANSFIRWSTDGGRTWSHENRPAAWPIEMDLNGKKHVRGVSEGSLVRAANGWLVAALRTDMHPRYVGDGIDNLEGTGVSISRDDGATWSPYSMLDGQPGSEGWDDPANQPPGHLGISAITSDEKDPNHVWAIVQGLSLFETTDDGKTWTPRNRGLRADWPREHEEVGFCVHKVVFSPADEQRMFQQNHVGMHRSDDAGATWTEITEGLPTEFGFAAAAHPHDRDTFHVIPLDPGHGRTMPDGKAAVWRTKDAGSSWERLSNGLPQENAYLGVLRHGMSGDTYDTPGYYFGTSTGQVFASVDDGESWSEIASYLPAISSVEVAIVD